MSKSAYYLYIIYFTINKLKQKMCQRKIWKHGEDQILKQIVQVRQIKKWSETANIMEKEFGVKGRNGKQCRERYHNHLKAGIKKGRWTQAEEEDLIQLHMEHGNKWALISKHIPGRSENSAKNMLYSRLRRSTRLLNRFIMNNHRNQIKQIKSTFIFRLIDFTEKSYRQSEAKRSQQENASIQLKNELLRLEYDDQEHSTLEEQQKIKTILQKVCLFKRATQRYRGKTTACQSTKFFGENIDSTSDSRLVKKKKTQAREESSTSKEVQAEEREQQDLRVSNRSVGSPRNDQFFQIKSEQSDSILNSSPAVLQMLIPLDKLASVHDYPDNIEEFLWDSDHAYNWQGYQDPYK